MPFIFRFNELVISPKGKGDSVARASQLSSSCTQLQRGDTGDNRCLAGGGAWWHSGQKAALWEQLAALSSPGLTGRGTQEIMCATQIAYKASELLAI